jgi:integrase
MSAKLPYLRRKVAKGRDYYYFDAGTDENGRRVLTPLPHIRDKRFGDCYARAKAERTRHKGSQGSLTLDGLIRSYEKSPEFRGHSQATQDSYSRYLEVANRQFRTKAGFSVAVKQIERKDVLALRDALADTPGAANQTMRALGAMFAWAVDNDKIADNPAKRVKRFASKPHKEWPEKLLEEALADPQVGMAVALFFFTGQRINEVAKMGPHHLHGDYMDVYQQKKKNWLRVAILPELADMLAKHKFGELTILTNANGRPWTTGGLRAKLQTWAKARGHKVVPHGLRKNAVNALFEAGCTAAEVSGITDQSIAMLEHYAKGRNKLRLGRAAVVKLEAARKARQGGQQ